MARSKNVPEIDFKIFRFHRTVHKVFTLVPQMGKSLYGIRSFFFFMYLRIYCIDLQTITLNDILVPRPSFSGSASSENGL
jgi:hypothetical protein